MAASSFYSLESRIKDHESRIETLDKEFRNMQKYGDMQYESLYEIMWRKAEVESLLLRKEARDHLSKYEFPVISDDLKELASSGLDLYRSNVDKLRLQVPPGPVTETLDQTRVSNSINENYQNLSYHLRSPWDAKYNRLECLKNICNAISWWNDGHGLRCHRCGQIQKIIPKSLNENNSDNAFQVEYHQIKTGRTGWSANPIYFRCRLQDPNKYAVTVDHTFEDPSEIQRLNDEIAVTQQLIADIRSSRNPAYRMAFEDATRKVEGLQFAIASIPRQKVSAFISKIFSEHPLGHKFCHLPDVLDYIRKPKPISVASPLPFENYLHRTTRPEDEIFN